MAPINCNWWTQLKESHLGSQLALTVRRARGQKQFAELTVYLSVCVCLSVSVCLSGFCSVFNFGRAHF